ncbi:MAG: hypothetical protein RLY43_568 [Bacteroidota bacterium]|jgi:predicted RNA-binding protein Jag
MFCGDFEELTEMFLKKQEQQKVKFLENLEKFKQHRDSLLFLAKYRALEVENANFNLALLNYLESNERQFEE